ncbi:excinuclease ABC subunit UvrC, partial [bacterium]
DFIVTANEKEALFLEDTLLKKYKPKYNIRLKDSKTYVSVKLTMAEKFPRILIVRQIKKDGSRYFGPYISSRDVRDTIKLLRKIFPLRACSTAVFSNRVRPCLDYQLGICSAPAVGRISEEKYAELVKGAIMFLEGRNSGLIKSLKTEMDKAAAEFKFEEAAGIRDKIRAIESMLERQIAVTHSHADQDVFSIAENGIGVCVQALFIRDGRLVNSVSHHFKHTGLPAEELMSSFLSQFYRGDKYAPDEVIIPFHLEDEAMLTEWLIEKASRKVKITAASRGTRSRLLRMAFINAKEALSERQTPSDGKNNPALEGLKKRLHLRRTPRVIEAFDISNIGSSHFVGAMVTFKDGAPDKAGYRLFKIKNAGGPDDYAMMKEVLERRYKNEDMPLPDITLIDGGKGQLNIALSVARELGLANKLNIIALAKEKPGINNKAAAGERIFLPNVKDPVLLREGTLPDLLLQRIRDEVHRFAVSYARKLKSKTDFTSPLDAISGIGAKKKKALYEKFGSLEGIMSASVDELAKTHGITKKLAGAIKEAGTNNIKSPSS